MKTMKDLVDWSSVREIRTKTLGRIFLMGEGVSPDRIPSQPKYTCWYADELDLLSRSIIKDQAAPIINELKKAFPKCKIKQIIPTIDFYSDQTPKDFAAAQGLDLSKEQSGCLFQSPVDQLSTKSQKFLKDLAKQRRKR